MEWREHTGSFSHYFLTWTLNVRYGRIQDRKEVKWRTMLLIMSSDSPSFKMKSGRAQVELSLLSQRNDVMCFRVNFNPTFALRRVCLELSINGSPKREVENNLNCFPLLHLQINGILDTMAEKKATVYIVDVGKSMAKCNGGRTITDLDWMMRYIWDKITTTVRQHWVYLKYCSC